MMPVQQTRVGVTVGDCFRAALASVLEVRADYVPDVEAGVDEDGWLAYIDELRRWLEPRFGLDLWGISLAEPLPLKTLDVAPWGLWIAGVRTVDPRCAHALVCRGQEVVWDPYPPRDVAPDYIADPVVEVIWLLVPLDPARAVAA